MSFIHSTHYQSDYFELVGQMIAQSNQSKDLLIPAANAGVTGSPVLGVVINNSYGLAPIKHCAEEAWRLNSTKANMVSHVLAIFKGTVVGVFKVKDIENNQGTRVIFDLEMAEKDEQLKYLGKKVPGRYIKGPVLYF